MTKQDNSKPQANAALGDTAAPSPALGPAPASGPATPSAILEQDAPRETKSRDGLIVASIVVISAAVGVMCFSQLGQSLPISGAAGIVTLALLMLVHKQTQKSAQIAQLKAELAQSRMAQKPKVTPRVAPAQAAAPSTPSATEARIRELSRDIGNIAPRPEPSPSPVGTLGAPPAFAGPAVPERVARPQLRPSLQSAVEGPAAPKSLGEAGAAAPQASSTASGVAPAAPEVEGMGPQSPQGEAPREQWSFRPRTDAQASVQEASAVTNALNGSAQAPVATTIEGDLELVQRKIKELADEVNAAEALRPKPQLVNPRPKAPSSPLEDSIGALRAAARSMRGRPSLGDFIPKFEAQAFDPQPVPEATAPPAIASEQPENALGELVIPATAERIAGSDSSASGPSLGERDVAPPSLELPLPDFAATSASALPSHIAAITRAVENEAIDVLLGPIVTLAEHSVSHYEMAANLRSETGAPLKFSEDDFASIDNALDTQFDIARFNRAAALAARMDARDREGSLLAEFLGSSMTSRAFLETFANAYEARQRISAQLVLTFSQRAVDDFSPAAWQALRDMHSFGFRFALDKVRHVGTDFAALQRSGFRFVRIEAQTLLDGMTTPERFVPADEILQRATLAGLSIIAADIRDAATQKRLLDAGVLLGQGPLFGAPRQVNVDSGSGPADQSAAA